MESSATQPMPSAQPIIEDVSSPTNIVGPSMAATAPTPDPTTPPMLIEHIPVAQPKMPEEITPQLSNPAMEVARPLEQTPVARQEVKDEAKPEPEDHEFDKMLKDASDSSQHINAPKPQSKLILKAVPAFVKIIPKPSLKSLIPKVPFITAMVAIVVTIALIALAIFAFHEGAQKGKQKVTVAPSRVGTSTKAADSIQAAGGTLISPNDLDTFSQSAASQLNNLNDKQNFDASSLSDKTLGL